ncbi:MAG: UDP-2,3-diacylglucosamine diphosphatase LpxI [Chitinispirillales bacterium]|nr:UDP-2,3-diacylglucosamine diphosphatase LpxI [Chitinispirillales bacterium]
MSNQNQKIALIAGNKHLPFRFADWAKRNGRDLYVIGIKGEVDESLKNEVDADKYAELCVTEISASIKFFKTNGIKDVVMIGGIAKAKLKFNLDIVKVAFRLLFIKNKHKGVFSILLSMFEKAGIKIRAIQEFMPELSIGEGALGKIKPKSEDITAFRKNWGTILDYIRTGGGQAVIIYNGEILAYENFKGTDDIARRGAAKRAETGAQSGGIMVKIMEPGQDGRLDLPVVGTGTVETLAKYGFDGIVVEAGRVITDGTAETIKLADEKGVFVYGVIL